jgi:hypothetical protein
MCRSEPCQSCLGVRDYHGVANNIGQTIAGYSMSLRMDYSVGAPYDLGLFFQAQDSELTVTYAFEVAILHFSFPL